MAALEPSPADRAELSGTIERVTFHHPETGFCVLRIQVRGEREPATLVGKTPLVHAGEMVRAKGRWITNPQHGRQFQADFLDVAPPNSPASIEKYLASGAVKGIGPELASRIVKCFGKDTADIFTRAPSRLTDVRGIGPTRLGRIKQSWAEGQAVRDILMLLQPYGVGVQRAIRIYRTYGDRAVATIRANPYQLTRDIRGIGFKTADSLAKGIGIPRDSPFRARAAIRYALERAAAQGHTGVPIDSVLEQTAELVGLANEPLAAALDAEVSDGFLIREQLRGTTAVFLPELYRAEKNIALDLRRLASGRPLVPQESPLPPIDAVARRLGIELAPGQRQALELVARSPVAVVTGGPGVGKTTLVRTLLALWATGDRRAILAAPTGRAAKRLAESTGRPAFTIHRLLGSDPQKGGFLHHHRRPLDAEIFIVDEVSMIDVSLAASFLAAVPTGATLVLVGDIDQLPSVGPGTFLRDVIESGAVPTARLTEVFRQAAQSRIVAAAGAIRAGTPPPAAEEDAASDFFLIRVKDPEQIAARIVELVQSRIPRKFGFHPLADIQVLVPMNRGVVGTKNLNRVLQQVLNPPRNAEIAHFGGVLRVGDKVMQTANNYDKDVFNGDLGQVTAVDPVEQEVKVRFDHRDVTFDFGELDELVLAYATTIHKSQGSEYPCVVLGLATQHFPLLRRNLLYTAVTRGRKLVVVVTHPTALSLALRQVDTHERFTSLARRLEQAFSR